MNRDRVLELANFLEQADRRSYDQLVFGREQKPSCDAPACIAGFACYLYAEAFIQPYLKGYAAALLLGLDNYTAHELFKCSTSYPKELAVAVLRNLAETDNVDWSIPYES